MTKEERDRLIQLFEAFKQECGGDEWQRSIESEEAAENAFRSFADSLVRE